MAVLFLLFPLLLISLGLQFSARRELNRLRVNISSLRHDRALDRSALETVRELVIEINDGCAALSESLGKLQEDVSDLAAHNAAEDATRERLALLSAGLDELRKSIPKQDEVMQQLREDIGKLSHELGLWLRRALPVWIVTAS